GERYCKIHCFHYEGVPSGLLLGMRGNLHLSRVRFARAESLDEGREYLVAFCDAEQTCVEGRERESEPVIAAVIEWLISRATPQQLAEHYSFVDASRRALLRIGNTVDVHLSRVGSGIRSTLE